MEENRFNVLPVEDYSFMYDDAALEDEPDNKNAALLDPASHSNSHSNNVKPKPEPATKSTPSLLDRARELFSKAGQTRNRHIEHRLPLPQQEVQLHEAMQLASQAASLFEQAQDTFGIIECRAELGDCKMKMAYIKTLQEQFDEVFEAYYRDAVFDIRTALLLSDEIVAHALQAQESGNWADAKNANRFSALSDAIGMVLYNADATKHLLASKFSQYSAQLQAMLAARDARRAQLGNNWKTTKKPGFGKSPLTVQRENLQAKLQAIEALQANISQLDSELMQLHLLPQPTQ